MQANFYDQQPFMVYPRTPYPLFYYQQEAVDATLAAYRLEGKQRMVVELPTGSGKTTVAIALCHTFLDEHIQDGSQALFITDRIDLVIQSLTSFMKVFDRSELGLIWQEVNQFDRRITIASRQTLIQQRTLDALLHTKGQQSFDLVIIDECQGAATESYIRLIDQVWQPDGLLVGLSATPYRSDGRSLLHVFRDGLVYTKDYFDLVMEGYLADILSYTCPTNLSFSEIEIAGLFSVTTGQGQKLPPEVTRKILTSNRYQVAIQNWKRHALGKRTIIFAQSVPDAYAFAEAIKAEGYECPVVTGTTPKYKRDQYYEAFEKGDILFISNFHVLTTGFDMPEIECIILGCATDFRGLITQIIGRGTRLCTHIDKTHCILLNLTGKQPIVCSLGLLLGKDQEQEGVSLKRALKEKLEQEAGEIAGLSLPHQEDLYDVQIMLREVRSHQYDIFTGSGWYQNEQTNVFTKGCPGDQQGHLEVERAFAGGYMVTRVYASGRRVLLLSGQQPLPLRQALARAQREIEVITERLKMEQGTSTRLGEPLTDRQLQYLKNRKVPHPPRGRAPDGRVVMVQQDYMTIKKHLDQYGGAFTKEGGCIAFREDKNHPGQWRIVRWPFPSPSSSSSYPSLPIPSKEKHVSPSSSVS